MATPRKLKTKRTDWESLKAAWIAEGMPPKMAFLKANGVNPKTGATWKKTKDWGDSPETVAKREEKSRKKIEREVLASAGIKDADPVEVADAAAQEPGTIEAEVNSSSETEVGKRPDGSGVSWQQIATFRRKQALEDWRTADMIRAHMKAILKKSLVKVPGEDGQERLSTSLKPHEVRQLAQTSSELQRVQRLALGLSTENLGIDPPMSAGDSHVEKNVTPTEEQEPVPLFICELSIGGKFLRPRPRRAR